MDIDPTIILRSGRFAMCSLWFMNAYCLGLNGTQAAWAAKKYLGHGTIPNDILAQFDKAHQN
ncbi:hypothetical protein L208DRAFT_1289148 [Tricholoma matsutake]|nr:hypothetical protein L208DRAFT_1289148 [Tricholoma matsutake 945]